MPLYVYQTFEIKQEKFKEAVENLQKLKKNRNENYHHIVDILLPIVGEDYTYALLATYDGLAEMELQNKKMYDDDKYLELVGSFFLENVVQGSMKTMIYRSMNDNKEQQGKKEE